MLPGLFHIFRVKPSVVCCLVKKDDWFFVDQQTCTNSDKFLTLGQPIVWSPHSRLVDCLGCHIPDTHSFVSLKHTLSIQRKTKLLLYDFTTHTTWKKPILEKTVSHVGFYIWRQRHRRPTWTVSAFERVASVVESSDHLETSSLSNTSQPLNVSPTSLELAEIGEWTVAKKNYKLSMAIWICAIDSFQFHLIILRRLDHVRLDQIWSYGFLVEYSIAESWEVSYSNSDSGTLT